MAGIHMRGEKDTETLRYREERCVAVEAEIGVKQPPAKHAKDCQEPPGAGNWRGKILFWNLEENLALLMP